MSAFGSLLRVCTSCLQKQGGGDSTSTCSQLWIRESASATLRELMYDHTAERRNCVSTLTSNLDCVQQSGRHALLIEGELHAAQKQTTSRIGMQPHASKHV
jgi:hypothetical protein